MKTHKSLKMRSCLKCDKLIRTTPEVRLCDRCRHYINFEFDKTDYSKKLVEIRDNHLEKWKTYK